MIKPLKRLFPIVLLTAAAARPTSATHADGIDYAATNAAIVQDHLLPRYHDFTTTTADLMTAAQKLCPDVGVADLEAVRTAFHTALDAWQTVEHIRQGPPAATDAHIRVKFWPDRKSIVDKHLTRLMKNKNPDILTPKVYGHVSIAVQGFPAMERLLFTEDAAARLKQTDTPVKPCAVVGAIAANLHAIAGDLEKRWTDDAAAGRKSKRVTTDLFNDLATGLGAVAELKLGAPLGAEGHKPRPRRAENWRSRRALRNVVDNLVALKDLYDGLAAAPGAGLAGSPEGDFVAGQFDQVIETAKSLGPSITAVLAEDKGPLRLKSLKGSILDLREIVVQYVAGSLDLVLGFNALDGD